MSIRETSDDWIAVSSSPLPVTEALAWATTPSCGAVVTFVGTVRDHSPGRPGVTGLEYEAYDEQVIERLARVAAEARRKWPSVGRCAILHRTGALAVTEAAVVVVVSTPSRPDAFAAARFCIDTVKATVPIWKRETWSGGSAWTDSEAVAGEVPSGFVLDLHNEHEHEHEHEHDATGAAPLSVVER